MRRLIGIVLLIALLAFGVWAIRLLWLAGTFRRITPHFAGTCRLIKGPVGPEDITIHPRTGIAYVSANDRRAVLANKPVPGAIFAYDLNQNPPTLINLTPHADTRFQPHGISLWAGPDGRDALFVVNHPMIDGERGHNIEIFDVTDTGLIHRATLTDPLLVMPNDIVAVALDRFYVTNTNNYPPGTMQTLETYLQWKGAQVVFYGPGGFRPALKDLVFPNGINVSPDGRTLYVASTLDRTVRFYDRDAASEALHFRREVFAGSGLDNIEIDEHANLWIGSHPKLLRVEKHGDDPTTLSPSQVLRVAPDGTVDEIYMNDGSEISTSTVAAVRGNRMLVGNVFDDGFLDCERGAEPAAPAQP